jgi:hypothetical protein
MPKIINLDEYRKKRDKKDKFLKPKEKIQSRYFHKVPAEAIKGNLKIKDIETYSLEDEIIFVLKFNGGGLKILDILDDFYEKYESMVIKYLNAKNFIVIFDEDTKEFVAQITLSSNTSEELKQTAKDILEELRQKLLSS